MKPDILDDVKNIAGMYLALKGEGLTHEQTLDVIERVLRTLVFMRRLEQSS